MNKDRRNFLQIAGTLSVGAFLFPQLACNTGSTPEAAQATEAGNLAAAAKPSLDQFGIQLYTLRDDMPKDPKGVLQQIASFGYKQIEGYEGPQGMFWDMGHLEFKKYLDSLGLNMVSSHCDIKKDFETKAQQAAEIGMKYLICPYLGPQKSMDDWKKIVDLFNECGATCQKNGIRFAYHNHAYSFVPMDGVIPQDYVMDNTDPELVDFEMDIYWVITGKADPIAYMQKYPNRFRLGHVKDRMKNTEEENASCILGEGTIDYAKILNVAKQNGMEYFIVEQERYDNSTPLDSAKADAEYLKKLVFS